MIRSMGADPTRPGLAVADGDQRKWIYMMRMDSPGIERRCLHERCACVPRKLCAPIGHTQELVLVVRRLCSIDSGSTI